MDFMEHLNGCLYVIISMWKFYTCFKRMFLLLMQHRHQSSPLFSLYFCEDFYMFEIWCFTTFLIFWRISTIFLLVRNFFKTLQSGLPLCRNQPIDLTCLLMAWFLNNGNAGLKWVKENLTVCLDITPAWKP